MQQDPVRVLIVDDQEMFVFALRQLLADDDRIEIVAATDNAAHALELATTEAVDVVLMDLVLPGLDGIEATRRMTAHRPQTKVVVVTGMTRPRDETAAIDAGAVAFLRKGGLQGEVADAILSAAASLRP